jgi:hypothetical protein
MSRPHKKHGIPKHLRLIRVVMHPFRAVSILFILLQISDLYTPFEGPREAGEANQLGRLAMDLTLLVPARTTGPQHT